MDKLVIDIYKKQIDRGARCNDWLHLETTQEFLAPLKEKAAKLKDISYEDILLFDDKSFRSKVESAFLAAKEIEDYFALIDSIIGGMRDAQAAIEGKDVETY